MIGALAIAGCAHDATRESSPRVQPPLSDGRPTEDECGVPAKRPTPDPLAVVLRAPSREAASGAPTEADRRAYGHYIELRNLGTGPRELLQVLLTIGPSRNTGGVALLVAQAQAALGLDIEATANADLATELARQGGARPEVARRAAEVTDVTRPRIAALRLDLLHVRGDTKVWLDGQLVVDGAAPSVDAGGHQVSVFERFSGRCLRRTFDLGPGDRVEVRVADEIEILVAR
jgi:hypothetical protein